MERRSARGRTPSRPRNGERFPEGPVNMILSSIVPFRAVASGCALGLILSACHVQRTPEKEPADHARQTPAANTWTDIPVSKRANRVTIHYHRHDEAYDGAVIWSWDAYQKDTPKQNELAPIG